MPTILRFAGLRVVIYTNDHRPAHVHVIGDGCEAVFEMNCGGGPLTLRENYGFALTRLRRIKVFLQGIGARFAWLGRGFMALSEEFKGRTGAPREG